MGGSGRWSAQHLGSHPWLGSGSHLIHCWGPKLDTVVVLKPEQVGDQAVKMHSAALLLQKDHSFLGARATFLVLFLKTPRKAEPSHPVS